MKLRIPNQTPIVSIAVAVYNCPHLLPRALASLHNQTYTRWECLIVDDGSTDNTREVAREFVRKDARFQLIEEKHKGSIQARNTGIFHAKGNYITLLDSDDEYDPQHIELRVNELRHNPSIDLLHGGFRVIGDEMVPDKEDLAKRVSLYDSAVSLGGTIFAKKKVFVTLRGFKMKKYGSGSDFIEEASHQFNIKRVSWPTYIYYRNHGNSATDKLMNRVE